MTQDAENAKAAPPAADRVRTGTVIGVRPIALESQTTRVTDSAGSEITVRLDSGETVVITQAADAPMSVGQPVQVTRLTIEDPPEYSCVAAGEAPAD